MMPDRSPWLNREKSFSTSRLLPAIVIVLPPSTTAYLDLAESSYGVGLECARRPSVALETSGSSPGRAMARRSAATGSCVGTVACDGLPMSVTSTGLSPSPAALAHGEIFIALEAGDRASVTAS